MSGLDIVAVVHKLPLQPDFPPVKQKLQRTRPDMALKICEEVKRKFDVGFLEVAKYPQWVANIVPVPKKDNKVRMCVVYKDLNKASLKDGFPLPHIDTLLDNTVMFVIFSFIDGFSTYNQIKMATEDMEKTMFITPWGTLCYKVIPFRLKNAGATYQREMVTLFHDIMHKEIEVYVNDVITKSQSEDDHMDHLHKLFERLQKFQLRLTLAKCTFGVRSRTLLGFIASQRGIEVDPDKGKPLFIYLTVIEESMGCVLGQHDETEREEHMDLIKYIFENLVLIGRLARWQMLLSEYNIQYVSKKAIKGTVLSDYLVHQPFEDYQPLKFDFPDEDIMEVKDYEIPVPEEGPEPGSRWKLMFDGSSNYMGYGVGDVMMNPNGGYTPFTTRLCFDFTKNIAEYEACILGIKGAIDLRIKILEVRFCNEAPLIQIERNDEPSYCQLVEEEADGKPWFHNIKCYMQNQEYPANATILDKKTLRKMASKFFLINGVLYKRNHDMVLPRYVVRHEVDMLIKEIHDGSFGIHDNGHDMAKKILRVGYYWLTIESDCFNYARKCHKCQTYADKMHVPPTLLNVLTLP
ncbi:uncharacterized protein LOC127137989 [Lathyrus oleraceus]|uniref:uncharacterized protein LOC127137989 n=1 Tax=Pisum sativum TaxID=3888 RepID=UPI0021D2AECD|nr:uncharacterized protein LOC127137989 [Pisum sativum]